MKVRGCLIGLVSGVVLTTALLWLISGAKIFKGSRVGEIDITGTILTSRDTLKQLKKFRKDSSIKAILLRINSPGGAVGPSQEIYSEVRRTVTVKPVVVSMGSVAASGAFYLATAATRILADPGTLTGSIGVIIHLPNMQGLFGKIGYKTVTIKSGQFKDMGDPGREMTPAEQALLQKTIDATYNQFVRDVARARNLPEADVRKIADGRVILGEDALKLKLIDQIGDYEDALLEAGRLGGIKGEPEVEKGKKDESSLLDFLIGSKASEKLNSLLSESSTGLMFELPGFGR
ncbi:MAG: signal peptide peptidase SppA [Syntrophobacteraceae bacterium]|nr:signal peptide peptidase SppA [Syntrophobacteraceae bacterium]